VNPADPTSKLPDNASPWVKQAYEASLSSDPAKAVEDAKILSALLRKRVQLLSRKKTEICLSVGRVEWKEAGDVQFFDLDTNRDLIVTIGRSQGWNVTIVKCRKLGRLRAMAMSRRPIK
jgi:hypothetical protein